MTGSGYAGIIHRLTKSAIDFVSVPEARYPSPLVTWARTATCASPFGQSPSFDSRKRTSDVKASLWSPANTFHAISTPPSALSGGATGRVDSRSDSNRAQRQIIFQCSIPVTRLILTRLSRLCFPSRSVSHGGFMIGKVPRGDECRTDSIVVRKRVLTSDKWLKGVVVLSSDFLVGR